MPFNPNIAHTCAPDVRAFSLRTHGLKSKLMCSPPAPLHLSNLLGVLTQGLLCQPARAADCRAWQGRPVTLTLPQLCARFNSTGTCPGGSCPGTKRHTAHVSACIHTCFPALPKSTLTCTLASRTRIMSCAVGCPHLWDATLLTQRERPVPLRGLLADFFRSVRLPPVTQHPCGLAATGAPRIGRHTTINWLCLLTTRHPCPPKAD